MGAAGERLTPGAEAGKTLGTTVAKPPEDGGMERPGPDDPPPHFPTNQPARWDQFGNLGP